MTAASIPFINGPADGEVAFFPCGEIPWLRAWIDRRGWYQVYRLVRGPTGKAIYLYSDNESNLPAREDAV